MSETVSELFKGSSENPVIPTLPELTPEQTSRQVAKDKPRKQRKKTTKDWDEFIELLSAQLLVVGGGKFSESQLYLGLNPKELFTLCKDNGILISSSLITND